MPAEKTDALNPKWTLLRDLAVLQAKLVVDGFRDLVLLPASIIAAIVSFARSENGVPGPQFYKLLAAGKDSEQWIDLFGALRNAPDGILHENSFGEGSMDGIVDKVESFLVEEVRRGGVTRQAKARIDEALRKLRP